MIWYRAGALCLPAVYFAGDRRSISVRSLPIEIICWCARPFPSSASFDRPSGCCCVSWRLPVIRFAFTHSGTIRTAAGRAGRARSTDQDFLLPCGVLRWETEEAVMSFSSARIFLLKPERITGDIPSYIASLFPCRSRYVSFIRRSCSPKP